MRDPWDGKRLRAFEAQNQTLMLSLLSQRAVFGSDGEVVAQGGVQLCPLPLVSGTHWLCGGKRLRLL